MAPLPQQTTWQQYIGDGSTTVFIYPFYIPTDADIAVYITPPNTTPSPQFDIKILNVDYTVQGSGSPTFAGGTITIIDGAPVAGSLITVIRDVQNAIDTEFSQARNISGINLDNAFDILMLCIQQNTTNFQFYGLQYIVNSEVPLQMGFSYGNQIPRLPNNYIWVGQNGGVVAAELEQNPDWSTLRTQLLSEAVGTNGCSIIGYNDPNNSDDPQLLKTFLDNLPAYINNLIKNFVPTGVILDYGGTTVPADFLLCDGSAVSRTTYANLLAAISQTQSGVLSSSITVTGLTDTSKMYVGMSVEGIGIPVSTTIASIVSSTSVTLNNSATVSATHPLTFFNWGNGDGSTTFNVPGIARADTIGSGGTALSPAFTGNVVGQVGGEEVHTMTQSELVAHAHSINWPAAYLGLIYHSSGGSDFNSPGAGINPDAYPTIANTGSSTPFNEMPPGVVVTKMIKI
jgi:microcystin-dependent protein